MLYPMKYHTNPFESPAIDPIARVMARQISWYPAVIRRLYGKSLKKGLESILVPKFAKYTRINPLKTQLIVPDARPSLSMPTAFPTCLFSGLNICRGYVTPTTTRASRKLSPGLNMRSAQQPAPTPEQQIILMKSRGSIFPLSQQERTAPKQVPAERVMRVLRQPICNLVVATEGMRETFKEANITKRKIAPIAPIAYPLRLGIIYFSWPYDCFLLNTKFWTRENAPANAKTVTARPESCILSTSMQMCLFSSQAMAARKEATDSQKSLSLVRKQDTARRLAIAVTYVSEIREESIIAEFQDVMIFLKRCENMTRTVRLWLTTTRTITGRVTMQLLRMERKKAMPTRQKRPRSRGRVREPSARREGESEQQEAKTRNRMKTAIRLKTTRLLRLCFYIISLVTDRQSVTHPVFGHAEAHHQSHLAPLPPALLAYLQQSVLPQVEQSLQEGLVEQRLLLVLEANVIEVKEELLIRYLASGRLREFFVQDDKEALADSTETLH